mmetsp:Transcript_123679/g.227937  ORF Transcript_123679/g.227937 Transcript_123679/m.227937 type:complete len:91 (+) Transcript_123679:1839-2111(+)
MERQFSCARSRIHSSTLSSKMRNKIAIGVRALRQLTMAAFGAWTTEFEKKEKMLHAICRSQHKVKEKKETEPPPLRPRAQTPKSAVDGEM